MLHPFVEVQRTKLTEYSPHRRSLGANYETLFKGKQKQEQSSPKSPSQSNSAEEPMETNQVNTEEDQGSKVRGGEEEENNEDEERVTSSSDCKKSGGSDPVRAFQEDMDMEGLSGKLIDLLKSHDKS